MSNTTPPRWADRFLELYCNPALLEQIQGDLYELYELRLSEGERAKRKFIWDVIRFCRWKNIRRSTQYQQQFNQFAMFKNHFKIGWRNLIKQRGPAFINIVGLSLAIACCLVAYLFIESVWMKGMLHSKKEQLYMITHFHDADEGREEYGYLATPLAFHMKDEVKGIEGVSRINNARTLVKVNDESYNQFVQYVDDDYSEMFDYNYLAGGREALKNPNQVVITEGLAQKFFRDGYAVGEELIIAVNGENRTFQIGGVIEDLKSISLFDFEILMNNEVLNTSEKSLDSDWNRTAWTFIEIGESADPNSVLQQLGQLSALYNQKNEDYQYAALGMVPMMDIAGRGQEINGGAGRGPGPAPQITLAAIGTFMLLLAVFNYVNIALLIANRRIKEIGVRKVIGSGRSQLIFQFLTENFMTCLISIVLSLLIAHTMFIPWFNELARLTLYIDLLNNPYIYLFLGGLLIVITVLSGAYPAVFISAFKPVQIFRSNPNMRSKGGLFKTLLTFQFSLSIITIVAAIAFVNANSTNEKRDWGYDQSGKVVVNISEPQDFREIKKALNNNKDVVGLAGSVNRIGSTWSNEEIVIEDEELEANIIRGEAGYAEVMGLRLKHGRYFNENLQTDLTSSIMVNETFMKWYDLEFPTDKAVSINDIDYEIVGVLDDFHYTNFAYSVDPTVMMAVPDTLSQYLTIKTGSTDIATFEQEVKRIWHQHVDDAVYNGVVQADMFDMYFLDMRGVRNVMLFTAVLAVFLAAMGLFGLVSLHIDAKLKDIGIRKVLGAQMADLSMILGKKYLPMIIIGAAIGSVLGYMAINALLDSVYAFHAGVGAGSLVVAILVLLIVCFTTISMLLVKVKRSNPTQILRAE